MTVKLDSVKIDVDLEVAGAWEDSDAYPGVKYYVRGARYQPFETARDLASQALAKKYRGKAPPRDVSTRVLGENIGEHILLGWEGFDVPYDKAGAIERLRDVTYRNLLDDVLRAAMRVGVRDLEFAEDLAKN